MPNLRCAAPLRSGLDPAGQFVVQLLASPGGCPQRARAGGSSLEPPPFIRLSALTLGYARITFALYAFAVAQTSPLKLVVAYFLSFVCDELDGRFARKLGQVSTLGVVLDMVTDR